MRILALTVAALCACASSQPRTPMPTETNKQVVRRLYDEFINPNHFEKLDELVSDQFVGADGSRGPAAFVAVSSRLRGSMPDLHYTIEDLVAEGDRVVVRWTLRGTHTGSFRGLE